jgi:3-oxoacyl-[acyl-carrier protein] reductase
MRARPARQVKELAGKVALVTGGAARVGRSIALSLGSAGADVAIGYLASAAAAHATVSDLRALGVRAVALRADIGRPAAAQALVAQAAGRLGRLDVLVNNAAVFLRTPLAETTAAEWIACSA